VCASRTGVGFKETPERIRSRLWPQSSALIRGRFSAQVTERWWCRPNSQAATRDQCARGYGARAIRQHLNRLSPFGCCARRRDGRQTAFFCILSNVCCATCFALICKFVHPMLFSCLSLLISVPVHKCTLVTSIRSQYCTLSGGAYRCLKPLARTCSYASCVRLDS
jgi:hypothetical protein